MNIGINIKDVELTIEKILKVSKVINFYPQSSNNFL